MGPLPAAARAHYDCPGSPRAGARDGTTTGDGTIAGQYGGSSGQKQQYFGKVDPFCLFAVVPLLIAGVFVMWSGIASLGLVLIILALLVVGVDSWANRPPKKSEPRYRDNR
ncbi:hypothetical protein [Actinophytocola oryzae]|uniref:Uncharacterized protein n=1 Tax=Actinophytocola oryzae TaxID=502181 RepID=A0A4R7V670_9PSEU|nr:hypothetical protein [Actinophytocola oryzae]TDV44324.1 hypothetical protein CLV71_114234 [Actinophytocola oryzae]